MIIPDSEETTGLEAFKSSAPERGESAEIAKKISGITAADSQAARIVGQSPRGTMAVPSTAAG